MDNLDVFPPSFWKPVALVHTKYTNLPALLGIRTVRASWRGANEGAVSHIETSGETVQTVKLQILDLL